jgi:outer membrane protein OmpA-like peptidoglycan-associated protein
MWLHNFKNNLRVLAATFLVASCATPEPEALPEESASIPTDPAIYNISGRLTDDETLVNRLHELRNSGHVALASDEVDAYQDQQEARWRAALTGTELDVIRIDNNLHIRMPAQSIFSMDSADIDLEIFSVLETVAAILNEYEQSVIEISSHTDGLDSPSYNQELSSRRAESIVFFLESRNVNLARVIEIAAGATHSVGDDNSAAGRNLNRRIELTLIPLVE